MDAVKGDKTLTELVRRFYVHPNQAREWKCELLGQAAGIFEDKAAGNGGKEVEFEKLHAMVGELNVVNDF